MVRSLHKTKILFVVALILAAPAVILSSAKAANPENLDLQVNIAEALEITVTNPTSWAKGGLTYNSTSGNYESDFLRNKVSVSAKTNSPKGMTVSMYTKNDTDLRNTVSYNSSSANTYIPTLASSSTVSAFPVNYWGYSTAHIDPVAGTTDTTHDNDAGLTTAVYNPLSTSAIQLFKTTGASNDDIGEDVYFGAKADNTKDSGTYARTVYFAVVTNNPDGSTPTIPPTNPSTPDPVNEYAHYNSTTGSTTYTSRTTSGSGTDSVTGEMENTTTEVTAGDITTTYAQAYGVTSSSTGSALATAFAVAAGVSAVSGFAFFVAAKRKKDDDDEEGS
ncbi:MAG: hypothetical protein Q4F58_01785 [Candidatus Saccharibacteria bacterium]|nr:hypothetical protein [Candidatus Saccharibacteria bacterium]